MIPAARGTEGYDTPAPMRNQNGDAMSCLCAESKALLISWMAVSREIVVIAKIPRVQVWDADQCRKDLFNANRKPLFLPIL